VSNGVLRDGDRGIAQCGRKFRFGPATRARVGKIGVDAVSNSADG
jgi:hypothetical protein